MMKSITSLVFSLDLNLATRSCVVTGVFCCRTTLISSSVTGPVAGAGAAFDDAEGVAPLEVAVPFEDEAFSSFTGFDSCIQTKIQLNKLIITDKEH